MPIMPQYRSPYGQSIAELLMRQGEIAARGAERSGQIWGNAVQNLGQIGAQAYEQHREQQQVSKRDAALGAFVDSGSWISDPQAAIAGSIKILGPREGVRFAEGLIGAAKLMGGDPAEAGKALPMMARGFLAAPDSIKPSLYGNLKGVLEQSKLVGPGQMPDAWSPDLAPMFQAYAGGETAPKTRQVEVTNADGSKSIQIVEDKPGQTFASAAPPKEVKPPATQNIGGKVMQFNPESGRFDIPLGASEAALNREAAGAARVVAAEQKAVEDAEKKAAKAEEAAVAKRANDEQVASAFAAMKAALSEVEKYAGSSALTSPLEAANARQQYDSAAKAFAATLSRATGDTRISDNDRKAYAGLLTYTGPGKSLLMITRPDLTRKRLEEAEGFFAAASGVRGGGNASSPPPRPVTNAEKSTLLKKYGF